MSKREIVIRLQLPQKPRTRWLIAGATAILCASAIVYATVPNIFSAGDPLSASKVNANFSSLDSRVTTVENKPAGGKNPGAAAGNNYFDTAVHTVASVSITAPAAGTVMVASTGWIAFFTHTNGTQDILNCCLDGAAACGSSSYSFQEYQVPASWPTVAGGGANFNMSWPLTAIATIPVAAAGAVTVNLNCQATSDDGNGYITRNPHLQAFYLPGQY